MNKKIKILICFLVVLCLAIAGTCVVHKKNKIEAENTIITYDDPVFEEAVKTHYTAKEAAKLEGIRLSFNDMNECDMTDLRKFPNLKAIRILGATTENIEAISEIEGIEYLTIHFYEGTDITAIKDMKNLKGMHVGGSYEELKFIGEMTQLETLTLVYDTPVPDLLFLKNLKNLTRLSFENSDIESLKGLKELPQLEYFLLFEIPKEAALSEYQKIGGLNNLKQLALYTCSSIEELGFLAHLQKLELLTLIDLGTTDISVLSDLAGFPNLGGIALSDDIIEENKELSKTIEGILEPGGILWIV